MSFKNILTYVLGGCMVILTSCSTQPSLEEYYVNRSEDPNFISFDLPASLLQVPDSTLNTEQKEALQSLKKLNILAYKSKSDDVAAYEAEKAEVKAILSNDRYQELMRIKVGGNSGVIKYLGDDESIDELVLFGTNDDMGFALVRVLGEEMKPEKMMQLAAVLQNGNFNAEGLGQLKDFFDE